MIDKNNDLFTIEEKEALDKTRKLRLEMVEDIVEDGMPQKAGDKRILNETLDAIDRQVFETSKMRAKVKENNDNSAILGMVVEVLRRSKDTDAPLSNREISLNSDFIPDDVVPDETAIDAKPLELNEFIKEEEDE